MLVPCHALYDAGTSLLPLAVIVSTIAAIWNDALPDEYPPRGCKRAAYEPLPIDVACTTKPLPTPPVKPAAGYFDSASAPSEMSNTNGLGSGEMRSSKYTSVNVGLASIDAAFCPSPPDSCTTAYMSCAALPATDE